MTHTTFKGPLALAALAMATTANLGADTSYTSDYCSDSSVRCITITLRVNATLSNGKGEENAALDRISATLDAAKCGVTYGSGIKVFNGGEEMSVDSGNTILTRSWTVPTKCPYKIHMRHPMEWPWVDVIYYHRFDSDETSGDICLAWDIRNGNKSSCN